MPPPIIADLFPLNMGKPLPNGPMIFSISPVFFFDNNSVPLPTILYNMLILFFASSMLHMLKGLLSKGSYKSEILICKNCPALAVDAILVLAIFIL